MLFTANRLLGAKVVDFAATDALPDSLNDEALTGRALINAGASETKVAVAVRRGRII